MRSEGTRDKPQYTAENTPCEMPPLSVKRDFALTCQPPHCRWYPLQNTSQSLHPKLTKRKWASPPVGGTGHEAVVLVQGGYLFDCFSLFVGFWAVSDFYASLILCVHSASVFDSTWPLYAYTVLSDSLWSVPL